MQATKTSAGHLSKSLELSASDYKPVVSKSRALHSLPEFNRFLQKELEKRKTSSDESDEKNREHRFFEELFQLILTEGNTVEHLSKLHPISGQIIQILAQLRRESGVLKNNPVPEYVKNITTFSNDFRNHYKYYQDSFKNPVGSQFTGSI